MSRSAPLVLAAIGALMIVACGSSGTSAIDKSRTISDSACAQVRQSVSRATDSIPRHRACAYARRALDVLAAARPAEAGLMPSDTSLVSSATVDAIAETDSAGRLLGAWWLVTLHLNSKPYDAEVRLNQQSGEQSIRPVHK